MKRPTEGSASILDTPRVRFNWGFWDGYNDRDYHRPVRDVSGHFDPVYAQGYVRGVVWHGVTDSSDTAWRDFNADYAKRVDFGQHPSGSGFGYEISGEGFSLRSQRFDSIELAQVMGLADYHRLFPKG